MFVESAYQNGYGFARGWATTKLNEQQATTNNANERMRREIISCDLPRDINKCVGYRPTVFERYRVQALG